MTHFQIGHPAYGGANKYANVSGILNAIHELRARGVDSETAHTAIYAAVAGDPVVVCNMNNDFIELRKI